MSMRTQQHFAGVDDRDIKSERQAQLKSQYLQGFKDGVESQREFCTDAVSRKAVLDIVNNPLNIRLDEIIKKLPPVTPERPQGEWILTQRGKYVDITCSCCGSVGVESYAYNYSVNDLSEYEAREFAEKSQMYFCKVCGADMRGGKE